MTRTVPRWLLLIVLIACVLGLLLWARGVVHHHGQYVGALDATVQTVQE